MTLILHGLRASIRPGAIHDDVEVDFGSDPTLSNPDEDSYSDPEEYERGSSPLSYDLNGDEKVEASEAGLKYGDCTDCAIDAGLRIEQVESAEYLAGHFLSGVAVYGDIRDFALNLWKKKFVAAGLAFLSLAPYVGDGGKAVRLLSDFAKRGDRGAQAVTEVVDKLPLSSSVKKKVLAGLPSRAGKLPRELAGGPKIYMVYVGKDYVGITKNFAMRRTQHARAGRTFVPAPMLGASQLSLGQARAIEQACIEQGGLATSGGGLQNRINSINPAHDYQAAAVHFGLAVIKSLGAVCPLARSR